MWMSKIKVEVYEVGNEYTYKGYIIPTTVCYDGTGLIECSNIKPGQRINCAYRAKVKSPLRGDFDFCLVY